MDLWIPNLEILQLKTKLYITFALVGSTKKCRFLAKKNHWNIMFLGHMVFSQDVFFVC